MAEADQTEATEEPKKGGMAKLLIIGILGLVLLGGAVAGTLFFTGFFDAPVAEEGDTPASTEPAQPLKMPAQYFPLGDPFIVNYQARGRSRYLQAELSVMSRDVEVINAIELHLPLIRNQMVMLLGSESFDQLQSDEGKELLRQKALELIEKTLQKEIGRGGVEQVLFTRFVMQ